MGAERDQQVPCLQGLELHQSGWTLTGGRWHGLCRRRGHGACVGGLLPPWCSSPSLHPWVRCSPSRPGSQLSSPSDCLCVCRREDSRPMALARHVPFTASAGLTGARSGPSVTARTSAALCPVTWCKEKQPDPTASRTMASPVPASLTCEASSLSATCSFAPTFPQRARGDPRAGEVHGWVIWGSYSGKAHCPGDK